ncbi:GntR family transcriptional regulator [Dactylosporangium vinaceum]|uniref:GntR family transcriptional regulator n=1 Tax=Dactylosporangium vinaceum TaxID=53362 RepID=A0ABV5M2F7_9ACTN|nr:GntR family transcriptional regulator [Dactylosporangium vinaceum]UAB96270.1 GntR family transcriptional regulator [Dactylosporangium vinaceum]
MADTAQPAYLTVYRKLRTSIAAGEWSIDSAIPSISELQVRYGVRSLNTIRRAQQMLVGEGVLRTVSGVGAFVVKIPEQDRSPADMITEAKDLLRRAIALLDAATDD